MLELFILDFFYSVVCSLRAFCSKTLCFRGFCILELFYSRVSVPGLGFQEFFVLQSFYSKLLCFMILNLAFFIYSGLIYFRVFFFVVVYSWVFLFWLITSKFSHSEVFVFRIFISEFVFQSIFSIIQCHTSETEFRQIIICLFLDSARLHES